MPLGGAGAILPSSFRLEHRFPVQIARLMRHFCSLFAVTARGLLRGRRKLSRILSLFFGSFGLLSSLTLAGWMNGWRQRQSLAQLETLAATNAAFVSQLRLPRSPELAQRLSTILNTGVGFHFSGKPPPDWPPGLGDSLARLAEQARPASRRAHGYELAAAPLGEPGGSLILLRRAASGGQEFFGMVWIPSLSLAAACGGLAFALARGIAKPLEELTDWLPNLNPALGASPEPVPGKVTERGDEIGYLGRALEETGLRVRREQELRRQAERLATLGRVATSLAHEIKNPAAAIALHTELLDGNVPEDGRESLHLIREEVERITDLVNQWLFVAKPNPARKQPRDLREMLSQVARRLAPALEHARARFELVEGPPAIIEADAPRMEQALRNLLVNAAQAMPSGGRIRARVATAANEAILEIEDEGTGFTAAALQRFGEPFFSEREGGMGIGLTLAREVIQAHGGSIHPGNLPQGGARLLCRFPLCASSLPPTA